MRYPLLNLGQGVGQNLILSRDFNSFYDTAVGAASAIADIARSKGLSDDEQASVNQALGRIRDYTVPTVPSQAPCPSAPSCPSCPTCGASAPDNSLNYVLAGAALVGGLTVGALFL